MNRLLTLGVCYLLALTPGAVAEPQDCVINPKSTIALGSHQDGVLEELLVGRGDRVSKGQAVARLDSAMEKMNAELAEIRASSDIAVRSGSVQAEFRDRELQRLASLRDNQSISASVYEEAKIEHDLARLTVDSARLEKSIAEAEYKRARVQLERRTINSPVDGVVIDVEMAPGEYVHEQSTLMSIAQTDPLYVEVYLPVSEYGEVAKGTKATVRPDQPVGGEYTATVTVVDNVFDAASRTFGIRLELPNSDLKLPAGVRCTVEFEVAKAAPAP